jgi:diguanylate cyclase (GGDEF)-like protein
MNKNKRPIVGKMTKRDDLKAALTVILIAWILLVCLSFWWNLHKVRQERMGIALQTARAFFSQVLLTREWNSLHGGVYVPITKQTRPNPYLRTELRDITVNENLRLTKINPSFMTRQLSELAEKKEGTRFHITSLKPIRPLNSPDAWEKESLLAFEKGEKERGEFLTGNGTKGGFVYMAPLVTEEACLKCHTELGYKKGDIRGGIRITLPFDGKMPFLPLIAVHFGLGLCGGLIILLLGRRLQSTHEELRHKSVIDALTGIPNRRSFAERLFHEFHRSRRDKLPLTLMFCDIDFFKQFNDAFGQREGDKCLQKIAEAIHSTLKRPADFCARYGGEEFVIILPNTPQGGGRFLAETLRSKVEKEKIPHRSSSVGPYVTVSLGLVTMERDEMLSGEELIKRADAALDQAKLDGCNRIQCWQPPDTDDPMPVS